MAHDEELHEHDRGLSHDLPTLLSRRRALAWLGGTGLAVALAGCGVTGNDGTGDTSGAAGAAASTAGSSGTVIPEETAGPYPGDGSNGVNVLTESGIVRSDITRSFGSASGVAKGVPLTIRLKVLDTANGSVGRGRRRLPVALRHRRPLLAVLRGRHPGELPAWGAGDRRRRVGHPFRGVEASAFRPGRKRRFLPSLSQLGTRLNT
jgi:hypothetical protein